MDVVALNDRDSAICDHIFAVESAEDRLMVVDDLEIEMGYVVRMWQSDGSVGVGICLRFYHNMIMDELLLLDRSCHLGYISDTHLFRATSVVNDLDDYFLAQYAGLSVELSYGIGDQHGWLRMHPEIGG